MCGKGSLGRVFPAALVLLGLVFLGLGIAYLGNYSCIINTFRQVGAVCA